MEQVLFGGYYDSPHQINVEYNCPGSGYSWSTLIFDRKKLVSTDGKIKKFRVVLSAPPSPGDTYDFVLMLNGNPTALAVRIRYLETSGFDMINEITVTGGDSIAIRSTPTSVPDLVFATWSLVFEGDNPNESLILGGSGFGTHLTNTEYGQVMCGTSSWGLVENDFRQVVPTAGTIKDFYVELDLDPGTAPEAYRLTVRLNGATVGQSLIVTITANDKTGSDLVHNLAVVAGDVLTMMVEPINNPTVVVAATWGLTFVATVDMESIVLGGSSFDLDNAATEYNYPVCRSYVDWNAAEAQRHQLGQVCVLKKLHILLSAPPGAGNKYDFTIRIAGADSNVVATVSDAATTGNSAALEDNVALDEHVDLKVVPDDTPDPADAYWGFVCYLVPPPGWSGEISGVVDPAKVMGVAKANIAAVKGVA